MISTSFNSTNLTMKCFYLSLFWGFISCLAAQETPPPQDESIHIYKKTEPRARNTSTGKLFETAIRSQLEDFGYRVKEQIQVGTRPNGGKHMIDLVLEKEGKSYLVSLKWQQSSGTAEQKIPYEMICLSEALKQSRGAHQAAYLVLGGEGWTLKEFYLSGGLNRHLSLDQPVFLMGDKDFLTTAKKGLTPLQDNPAPPTR